MKTSIRIQITSGTLNRLEHRFYLLKEWPEFKSRNELIEAMMIDIMEGGFVIDRTELAEAIRHPQDDEDNA